MSCTQNKDILLRAGIARLGCLSHGERLLLLKDLDNITDLALFSKADFEKRFSREISGKLPDMSKLVQRAERDVAVMKHYGMVLMFIGESMYPEWLGEIPQAPFSLYCRGNPEVLQRSCVGIVGTRHPDMEGLKAAFSFAADCASHGMTVVSGLAYGIDTAAHKGAVSIPDGQTVAVLGCGVDTVYPASNRKLAAAIIEKHGCLISEYPPEEPVRTWQFPERNRIISGVSTGTMVIQAPDKSGALITADFALEQGRDLCIHPAAVNYAAKMRAALKKQDDDVFEAPTGVLRLQAEGAPLVSTWNDFNNLVSGRMHQGKLSF